MERDDGFDFAAWKELAATSPADFEARRAEAIAAFLDALPSDRRERLERFQWRLDRERDRARTPLEACVRFSEMLSEQVWGDGGLAQRFEELAAVARGETPPPALGRPPATVLDFTSGRPVETPAAEEEPEEPEV